MGVHLLRYQVTDAAGKTRNIVLPMADSEVIADIQSYVTANSVAIGAVLGGVITACSVDYALTLPGGMKATYDADHLVSTGGKFAYTVTGSPYRFSFYVPTYLLTLISDSKDIPRSGATDTFLNAIEATANVSLTDKHENPLSGFLNGLRVNRK